MFGVSIPVFSFRRSLWQPAARRRRRSTARPALRARFALLTVRGRQLALNGYLALSAAGGKRLIVTQSFGPVLADVLVKRDRTIHVMRSSPMFRPAWIRRYVAADLECIFGDAPACDGPVRMLSATHYAVERRCYKLDLQILQTQPGPQSPELFNETPRATP